MSPQWFAHVMDSPRPSPFFTTLPLLYIIVNTNWRVKKEGRPGNKATNQTLQFIMDPMVREIIEGVIPFAEGDLQPVSDNADVNFLGQFQPPNAWNIYLQSN